MQIRAFQLTDTAVVVTLWQACDLTRPWNNPHKDIERKLHVGPELFLVGEIDGHIIGSVMGGYDGHRGWINYLAVHPEHQGCGHARALMAHVETLLLEQGCAKINLQVRDSNESVKAFYDHIGFKDDQVTSFGKRLIPDTQKPPQHRS